MTTFSLPSVDDVAALPDDALVGVVLQLAALQAAAAARLGAQRRPDGPLDADTLLGVDEAAARLATTPDWLRRHGAQLGIAVPLSAGQVRYSARAIAAFIARHVRNVDL